MNKRGQSLVEFVIILPILILLLLGMIDIGKILLTKNKLESNINDMVEEFHNKKTEKELETLMKKNNKNVALSIKRDKNYTTIQLEEEISIITPGLNLIFKPPYKIIVERVITNEP